MFCCYVSFLLYNCIYKCVDTDYVRSASEVSGHGVEGFGKVDGEGSLTWEGLRRWMVYYVAVGGGGALCNYGLSMLQYLCKERDSAASLIVHRLRFLCVYVTRYYAIHQMQHLCRITCLIFPGTP